MLGTVRRIVLPRPWRNSIPGCAKPVASSPGRYSFNLDGTAVYMTRPRCSSRRRAVDLTLAQDMALALLW